MADRPELLLRHIHRLASGWDADSDAGLLDRLVRSRDEAAFAELVRRHGPMVLGVCRRILGDDHQAEDASRATFLVRVRKAPTIRLTASLAAWLHTVARHLALKGRRAAQRRRGREVESARVARAPIQRDPLDELGGREVLQVLDEELQRLPEVYRLPLILCTLEGRTPVEAARQLGWAPGSTRGRLARGRARLRARLARRGITLPADMLAGLIAPRAGEGGGPAALATLAGKAAGLAMGQDPPGAAVSAGAAALAESGLKSLKLARVKAGLALLLTVAAAAGAVALVHQAPLTDQAAGMPQAGPAPAEPRAGPALGPDAQEKPEPGQAGQARGDLYGDALPPGAVARLGTIRLRHPGGALSVAFTRDGKVLASGGRDGEVRLWDPATGKELRRLTGHQMWVQALAFTPDGKTLASGTTHNDRQIRLWDVAGGKQLRVFPGHPNGTLALVFAPDGKSMTSAGDDGMVCVRATADGKESLRFQAHKERATLAYAPDGGTVATGGALDPVVRLWDAAAGKEIRQFRGHEQGVLALAFAPDGKTLGSGSSDKTVRLWDVAGGKEVQRLTAEGPVKAVAFAPDGKTVAGGVWNGVGRVWDAATGKELCQLQGTQGTQGLAFAPDGKTLAGAGGPRVQLWDPATGKELFPPRGHEGALTALGFAPDGKSLTSVSRDDTVRVWDAGSGKELRRADGMKTLHWTTTFAPDGRALAVEGKTGGVRLWDAAAGKELRRFQVDGEVKAAACSADGKMLAAGDQDGKVRVWDVGTGKEVWQMKRIVPVGALTFAPDGKTLAVKEVGFNLQLCDAATGKELCRLQVGAQHVMAFAPDGKTLAASGVSTLDLWDVGNGKQIHRLQPPVLSPYLGPVGFAPGGRTLAACIAPEGFGLWDAPTGKLLAKLTTRQDAVRTFAFAPDGRTLALGMQDHTVRLWDAFTGQEIRRFSGHQDMVSAVAFAPDGRTVASGSFDGTGLIWDLTAWDSAAAGSPGAKDLKALWDDLGGSDAPRADRAFWALVAARGPAVSLLRDRLAAARLPADPRLGRLVADLDNDEFAVREKGTQELERLGVKAGPALRRALAGKPSAEARRRIERLLARLESAAQELSPELVQGLRAMRVLEQVGTPEARAVLEEAAAAFEEPTLAAEARAALDAHGRRK